MRDKLSLFLFAFAGMIMGFIGHSKSKDKTSIVVSVIALVDSILGLVHSYSRDKRIDDLSDLQTSLAYHPQWRHFSSKHKVDFDPKWARGIGDTTEVAFDISVSSEIIFQNKGSATGRLIGYISKDIPSREDDLRRIIQNPESEKTILVVKQADADFPIKEVDPDKFITINFVNRLNYVRDSWGTIHFLVVYENQAGGLFDTYYWIKYQSKSPVYDREGIDFDLSKSFLDLFAIETTNESSIIYTAEEKSKILSLFYESRRK